MSYLATRKLPLALLVTTRLLVTTHSDCMTVHLGLPLLSYGRVDTVTALRSRA
jgi:hypothetical protein